MSGSAERDVEEVWDRAEAFAERGQEHVDRYLQDQAPEDLDEAIEGFRQACELFDSVGGADGEPSYQLFLAELLLERGSPEDVEAALGHGDRVQDFVDREQVDLDAETAAQLFHIRGVGRLQRALRAPVAVSDDLPEAARLLDLAAALLPEGTLERREAEARTGIAFARWTQATILQGTGADAEIAERTNAAITLLDTAYRELPADTPIRFPLRYYRALAYSTRFLYLGGDAADHDVAAEGFGELLAEVEAATPEADSLHCSMATLALMRKTPAYLRAVDPLADPRTLERAGSALGPLWDEQTVESARRHLERLSPAGSKSEEARALISGLDVARKVADWDPTSERRMTEALEGVDEWIRHHAADDHPQADIAGLAHALQAGRFAVSARFGERPDDSVRAVESLISATEGLPEGHNLIPLLNDMLSGALQLPGVPMAEADAGANAETIERLERVLEQFAGDHPGRVGAMTRLAGSLLRQLYFDRAIVGRLGRVRDLLEAAIAAGTADPANAAINHLLLGALNGAEAMFNGDLARLQAASAQLELGAELAPDDHAMHSLIEGVQVTLLAQQYMLGGGTEFLEATLHYARAAVAKAPRGDGEPSILAPLEHLLAMAPLVRDQEAPYLERFDEAIASLENLLEGTPEGDRQYADLVRDLASLQQMRRLTAPGSMWPGTPPPGPDEDLGRRSPAAAPAQGVPRDGMLYPFWLANGAAAKVNEGLLHRDLGLFDEGIMMFAEACEAALAFPTQRWPLLVQFGLAFYLRYKVFQKPRDLSNAIVRLEEAIRVLDGGPGGSDEADARISLAGCYRERADRALDDFGRAVETGLEALRDRAADVLLESSTERAFTISLNAAGEAVDVARWALDAEMPEAAVEALERGRGMVLHSVTAETGIAALLREGGHEPLAREWETAQAQRGAEPPMPWDVGEAEQAVPGLNLGRVPSDLRQRVLIALEGTELERRLFAPPPVEVVADALRQAGSATMVYLVPADQEGGAGFAMLVGSDETVSWLPLPRLTAGPRSRVGMFAEAQQAWADGPGGRTGGEGDPAAQALRDRWRTALDRLCDWAWEAAMAPVLDRLPRGADGPPRLVLVPVGGLGPVPWQAARRVGADGRVRHACQDAIISYAASARQFTDAPGGTRPRRWDRAPALVRVGESGLYWASKEIEAIKERYYRDGVLLGGRSRRTADGRSRGSGQGRSTVDNVLAQLPRAGSGGASLLHLGCHAHAEARPVDSWLELSGGRRLGMTALLDQARARPRDAPGGLIILAACASDLARTGHDEALTLASAFLAAGAAGAVGARWPVGDVPTALFMMMFHHYLNSGYDDPATALRAAQVWMLEPRRALPPDLDPSLREELGRIDLQAPECWAAFTYQGR